MATTEFGQAVRREELALLAGISVDYVTRLEQARAASPSAQVVEALARALRLSSTERAYLFRLAGLIPPGLDTVPAYITPSVQRMLDRRRGRPARGRAQDHRPSAGRAGHPGL
jgi:transcriptional regulator with XRE-family HTH domain